MCKDLTPKTFHGKVKLMGVATLQEKFGSPLWSIQGKNSVVILFNAFWYTISLTFWDDYRLLTCTVIQSTTNPNSLCNEGWDVSRDSKGTGGDPEPQQLRPAGETLITRSSSSRSGLSPRDKPVAKWQICDKEVKISVWEACTLKPEFTPTIFIADTRQMTFKTNWDPSSELFGLLLIYFTLFCTSSILWVREKH